MRTTDNGYFLFANMLWILSYNIQTKILLSKVYWHFDGTKLFFLNGQYIEIDRLGYIFA